MPFAVGSRVTALQLNVTCKVAQGLNPPGVGGGVNFMIASVRAAAGASCYCEALSQMMSIEAENL